MTALAASRPLQFSTDTLYQQLPVEASATIYAGAACSLDGGFAEPLDDERSFVGFAIDEVNNAAGADGDAFVTLAVRGLVKNATVTGVSDRTHIGLPVYAPTSGSLTTSSASARLVGIVANVHANGTADVHFESELYRPTQWLSENLFPGLVPEALSIASGSATLDAEDAGKLLVVTGSATNVITLPATVSGRIYTIQAAASGVRIAISPNASDRITGPNIAGVDNKDSILTAATAVVGDYVQLIGVTDGWEIVRRKGIWAVEP